MSNLFKFNFVIYPILEYYSLGCLTYFRIWSIIMQKGAQAARKLWYELNFISNNNHEIIW